MIFKTPQDWYRRDRPFGRLGLLSLLAGPVSLAWAGVTARRIARARPVAPGIPVICVGNLTVGGTGKTPIVRELAKQMATKGVAVHVLTRGHGGRLKGPIRVEPRRHRAADVGDEALMMAGEAPVWVARDRVAGALAAASAGAQMIIMDDGHQNPSLKKALSLVVVDGETRDGEWPFGDGRVVPAGPMREPLAAGLARADAIVVVLPADLPAADPDLLALFLGKPVVTARLVPLTAPPTGPQVGFAGIGKPWKMERALKAAGCDLVDFAPLADHQVPSERFMAFLAKRAEAFGAGLITTEKDWARLSPSWRQRVTLWPVVVEIDDRPSLDALLAPFLSGRA